MSKSIRTLGIVFAGLATAALLTFAISKSAGAIAENGEAEQKDAACHVERAKECDAADHAASAGNEKDCHAGMKAHLDEKEACDVKLKECDASAAKECAQNKPCDAGAKECDADRAKECDATENAKVEAAPVQACH